MAISGAKRKAKQLQVPSIDEDPAERKRILNVLAQRRYRRRKKEHVQKLEQSAQISTAVSSFGAQSEPSPEESATAEAQSVATWTQPSLFGVFDEQDFLHNLPSPEYQLIGAMERPQQTEVVDMTCLDPTNLQAFEASFSFPLPSLPSSPSLSTATTPSNSSLVQSSRAQSTFAENVGADELYLPMLELSLLRGAMAVAKRLGVDSLIWSLDADSLFHGVDTDLVSYDHLPSNLRPTSAQIRHFHHPILDILPWPAVRDRLILTFSQPEEIRPPNARSPTALMDLVYDIEDSAEGVRIWGDNPYSDLNWEIGQKFFANWWWALNSQVVARSNDLRQDRGAPLLRISRDVTEID